MEKPAAKSKNKLLKFLPKAASAVTFQNPPFSPGRDKRSDNANKLKTHLGKGFSGPMISIIPAEARRKPKNSSFATQEPTSPKVSCMGQIKHKKKNKINQNKIKQVSLPRDYRSYTTSTSPPHDQVKNKKPSTIKIKPVSSHPEPEVKKKKSTIRKIFSSTGRKSDASSADHHRPSSLPDRAPTLSKMKQFASGRDTFANFDWKSQVTPLDSDQRNYYSDEEEEEEEDVIIPFSAPILLGGGGGVAMEPRKEINIWKRRTMAQPRPLQLNTLVRSI